MSKSQSRMSNTVPLDKLPAAENAMSDNAGGETHPRAGEIGTINDTPEPHQAAVENQSQPPVQASTIECPICGEAMVTLSQLNQHIDDSHSQERCLQESMEEPSLSVPKTADSARASEGNDVPIGSSNKQSIKVDRHGDSELGSSEMSHRGERLTRAHWQKPFARKGNVCQECDKPLNVKTGMVNCRMCGELFCSEHSKHVAKLANGTSSQDAVVYDAQKGRFAQVCRGCFENKPVFALGPQANSVDLTETFVLHRTQATERMQISRQVIVHRYIKLVEVLTQALQDGWLGGVFLYSNSRLVVQEKEIVPWQLDREVSHCRICLEKFSVFLRKHHCRLCGFVVNERKSVPHEKVDFPDYCSVQVPVPLFLAKLPGLNYSPNVRQNWARCVHESCPGYSFRCCKVCKNLLVGHVRDDGPPSDAGDVVAEYNLFLRKKSSIMVIIDRYRDLVQENSDKTSTRSKLLGKLSDCMHELEVWLRAFTSRYLHEKEGKLVPRDPSSYGKLASNVHAAAIMFLQHTLLEIKRRNDELRTSEKQRLAEQTRHVQENHLLTKRQVRELREQLMVLNEQQFIVQNSMAAAKKARRFDELVVLEENEGELRRTIAHVTDQLGEHAFTT